MRKISYTRHRFPPVIIQRAIWLYFRFPLSFRDVEEMLAERGIEVSYETVRRWVLKFGPAFAANIKASRPRPSGTWHLDEVFVRIGGKRTYLWRAVDDEGEVLEVLAQSRRNKRAALKLMRKLLKKQGYIPNAIVTDKLGSYAAVLRKLGLSVALKKGIIHLESDHVVCKPGKVLTAEQARLLKHFKEPMAEFQMSVIGYCNEGAFVKLDGDAAME